MELVKINCILITVAISFSECWENFLRFLNLKWYILLTHTYCIKEVNHNILNIKTTMWVQINMRYLQDYGSSKWYQQLEKANFSIFYTICVSAFAPRKLWFYSFYCTALFSALAHGKVLQALLIRKSFWFI